MAEVTQLLRQWSDGDEGARDRLIELVYRPLRDIAERHLFSERTDHTLQPTALVNELYLRFLNQRQVDWKDRNHFFSVAAHVMRRILVDHARRRNSAKRGYGAITISVDEIVDVATGHGLDLVALDTALDELAAIYPQQASIVELRFYGGLTIDQTASTLGISTATVSREWAMARAWLRRRMTER